MLNTERIWVNGVFMQILIIVVLSLLSITLFGLGLIINKFQLVDILAGYDPSKVRDPPGLARFVGMNLMIAGILGTFVVSAAALLDLQDGFWPAIFFVAVLFIFCLRIVLGQKKLEERAT
jgi:hypothetical protein